MNAAAPTLLADLDTLLNTESLHLNGDTVRDLARSADRSARELIAQRDAALEALQELAEPAAGPDAMCHKGICSEEKCGRCSRHARARAAIAQAEGRT